MKQYRSMRPLSVALMLCATLASTPSLAADAYPDKPIRMVVTYPPGGGADIVARLVAAKMSETLGQQVIVENRPGANGQIGANTVARSLPNGYTVMLDATGFSINPVLYDSLSYDARKDFKPVSLLVKFPNLLVKTPGYTPSSVSELKDAVLRAPEAVSYASSGTGSVQHLAAELFVSKIQGKMLHVPYKGGNPAVTDVAGGQVPVMFANGASALPFVKSGKVIPLATTGASRTPGLPDVPTMAEAGIADMEVYEWNALFVPSGTPDPIVDKLSAAAHAAVRDPDVSRQLMDMGGEPLGATPRETADFIAEQMATWQKVIQDNQIKPN